MGERDSEIEEDMVWKERGRWERESVRDGGRYGLEREGEGTERGCDG